MWLIITKFLRLLSRVTFRSRINYFERPSREVIILQVIINLDSLLGKKKF